MQEPCRTCVAPCSLGPDATAACVRVGKVEMELGLFRCLSAALIPEPNVFQTWGWAAMPEGLFPAGAGNGSGQCSVSNVVYLSGCWQTCQAQGRPDG